MRPVWTEPNLLAVTMAAKPNQPTMAEVCTYEFSEACEVVTNHLNSIR